MFDNLCSIKVSNRLEARGLRMHRDNHITALRIGAMTLSGRLIYMLQKNIESCNLSLNKVPAKWAMSNGELCALAHSQGKIY